MARYAAPGQERRAVTRGALGGLTFGIYPGSAVGDAGAADAPGPPDHPGRINKALGELQGSPGRPFIVRRAVGQPSLLL